MKIKNIEKVAERIIKATKNKERIIIYGDSDMDGISSMIILKETIDNISKDNDILAFSPMRNDGHGLNSKALEFIKSKTKEGLIITLDCGITNFEEIKDAKKSGFSIVVVDHHKPLDFVPEDAEIVVAPKQEGDETLFKEYANVGLTFKLAEEILKDKMSPMLRESFLELVALGTISDMMIEEGENKEWIEEGLKKIEMSNRPSIRAIFSILNPMDFTSKRDMVSKVNSALNSSSMNEYVHKTYLFLLENDFDRAVETAKELIDESNKKQREVAQLTNELIEKFSKEESNIIFDGSYFWKGEYLGAVASRLCNFFNKPVFIYRKGEENSRGTVRVPKGFDAVKAMDSCKNLLLMYGGHPPAAGFTIKNGNIDLFKESLIKYFN
ncbi:MAG: DHH family phosphoesterase [Candidatus Pacebacteria bacterium]|nr:DHH family phosphoesterase [Candidatus Paceibacterota bacterium]MDD4073940.1 DHH family phosphoesterase [Candidatus Paceibacterota bacterium]